MKLLDSFPMSVALVLALTLGLAPFAPEPHIWEKLKMLVAGNLTQGADIFDLFLHGAPWVLLAAKALRVITSK